MSYFKKITSQFPTRKIFIGSSLLLIQSAIQASPAPATPVVADDSFFGPLQLQVVDSSPYGSILFTHWTNYFTPRDAFGFEVDYGNREFRLNGTWAHALTLQQRFKISAEHFAQRPDYSFVTGTGTQWQGQNDGGAVYQYLLNSRYVKALNFSAYLTDAENENFSTAIFTANQQQFTDIRHSAGANSYGGAAGLQFQFWAGGLLNLAANYDVVHYSPLYVAAPNKQGPGVTAGIEQLITSRVRVAAAVSDLQPYNQYGINLSWLAYTRPGRHLEVAALGSRVEGDIPTADNRIGLSLAYSWGGNPDNAAFVYTLPTSANAYDLTSWTTEPAVHAPAILGIKDELVTSTQY